MSSWALPVEVFRLAGAGSIRDLRTFCGRFLSPDAVVIAKIRDGDPVRISREMDSPGTWLFMRDGDCLVAFGNDSCGGFSSCRRMAMVMTPEDVEEHLICIRR